MANSIEDFLAARRGLDRSTDLAKKGWYHSFELPDGRVIEGLASLDLLRARVAQMPIPQNLAGKRVLDIGAWDGWFSFEMERRGAEVMAVDCVEVENFLFIHKQLGSSIEYRIMDMYDLSPEKIGRFDIVLFLGVLYHLKHPLLALEKVCALTRELAIVDSFVTDYDADWQQTMADIPRLEFYETDELGGQLDNWFGPNLACVLALCRTAGFARVSVCGQSAEHACVACHRQWQPAPPDTRLTLPAPKLTAAVHYRNYGLNFDTRRDNYVCCWFDTGEQDLNRKDVYPEVSGYGVRPIAVRRIEDNHWQANFMLPPGLVPGWHELRLRLRNSAYSNASRIAVDFPRKPHQPRITGACDGISLTPGVVQLRAESFISLWVSGLPENADCNLARPYIEQTPLSVVYVSGPDEHPRQINARVPASIGPGRHQLIVKMEDSESPPVGLTIESLNH